MILELKIRNFLSFKDEVTISFEATNDRLFEDCQVVEVAPDVRLLRLAVVYGANASGKSNLVEAFEFLRKFWFNITESKEVETGVEPFLLSSATQNEPSKFSLTFYIDGVKYLYRLELDRRRVISEKLFKYPGTQPAMIFERELRDDISEITFNPRRARVSTAAREAILVKCLTNMSVLAAYNQVNVAIPEIDTVVKWIRLHFNLLGDGTCSDLVRFTENAITENPEMKEYILNFLRRADFNISDVSTEIQKEDVYNVYDGDLRVDGFVSSVKTRFEHNVRNAAGESERYVLRKRDQSKGTLRLFGLAGKIYQTIRADSFLAIDEIESSLHPHLVEFLIGEFFLQGGQSQLLLTTHCSELLEEDDLLRNDSVWFTEKRADGSTDVYSLADFNGINRISSIRQAYKYGKFGAIPNI